MRLGASRRDREHLGGEVRPAPRVQPAIRLQVRPVALQRRPQRGHALAAHRLGEHDRHLPGPVAVEAQDRAHLGQHRARRRVVHLVDRDRVRDLHDPRLERLHGVARPRHQHEHDAVGDADYLHLALTGAHGLQEDDVLAGRVEQEQRLQRRLREPAQVPARPHRADEHVRVEEVLRQADPVAQQGALREGAGRVDRDDAHPQTARAHVAHERGDQRRLAHPRRPGDAHRVGAARLRVELAHEPGRLAVAVLHERDRPRQRPPVAAADAGDELLVRPALARHAGDFTKIGPGLGRDSGLPGQREAGVAPTPAWPP